VDVDVGVITRQDWWDQAACRGQDAALFFAPSYFEKRAEKTGREAVATRCAQSWFSSSA
jgi:hypothetical protein